MRPHRGEQSARAIKRKQRKGKNKKTKVGYRAPAALPVPSQNTTISSEVGFSDLKMPLFKSMGSYFVKI